MLRIVDCPVALLSQIKDPSNPRWISEQQMEALTASLTEFKCVEPIIINLATQQVVGGHQRIDAAVAIGLPSLPAVLIEIDPVQQMALNLALNKIKGDFDYAKLAKILNEIDDSSKLEATGFTQAEADSIVASSLEISQELQDSLNTRQAEIDGVRSEAENRTLEEVDEILQRSVRIQFGMFSKVISTEEYETWVESLKNELKEGQLPSPTSLGEIVARRLGIPVLTEDESDEFFAEDEAGQSTIDFGKVSAL